MWGSMEKINESFCCRRPRIVTKELLIWFVTCLRIPVPVRHHHSTLPSTNQSNSDPELELVSPQTLY